MNRFEALVEIVKATPPNHRSRSAIFAIVVLALPAAAGAGAVVGALLH